MWTHRQSSPSFYAPIIPGPVPPVFNDPPHLDFSLCRTEPFKHQIVGVERLVTQNAVALFDEMGSGKTKQVIDAACFLYKAGKIDTVLVICPSSVRHEWKNLEFGQIATHSWVLSYIYDFHSRRTTFEWVNKPGILHWVITNYEFVRERPRRDYLVKKIAGRKVLIVYDESSFIKSHVTLQTKACFALRKYAQRAVILNGTPIGNNILDLYSQLKVMNPYVWGPQRFPAFRSTYTVLGGYLNKQIKKVINLENLQERIGPYILRRTKEDCLDLPPKLYSTVGVPLGKEAWRVYCEMRDQMVVWLNDATPAVASHAIVKLVRLAQITSGFMGKGADEKESRDDDSIHEISSEKQDFLVPWLLEKLQTDQVGKIIVWSRFRAEQQKLVERLGDKIMVGRIYGGQNPAQRGQDLEAFTQGSRPMVLVAQPQAGGFGLNLTSAFTVVYLSNDYSLITRLQSEDRCHRSGQERGVNYLDILATGPEGQKTIDHQVLKLLKNKQEFAKVTTDQWREMLLEE